MSSLKARKGATKTSTEKQVVRQARKLITPFEHWIVGEEAQMKDGRSCATNDPKAVRFCAWGSLVRAAFEITADLAEAEELAARALELCADLDQNSLISMNDELDRRSRGVHRDILDTFDRAAR